MRDYKEKGKIGNITPRSSAHAQKIAIAIAMRQAGKSKPKRKGGKKYGTKKAKNKR